MHSKTILSLKSNDLRRRECREASIDQLPKFDHNESVLKKQLYEEIRKATGADTKERGVGITPEEAAAFLRTGVGGQPKQELAGGRVDRSASLLSKEAKS